MEIKIRCYDLWSNNVSLFPHSPWLQGANNFIGIIWETKRIHLVERIYTKHRCFREGKRKLESVKTDLPKMVATIEYSWNKGSSTASNVIDQTHLGHPLPRSQPWHYAHLSKRTEPCSSKCGPHVSSIIITLKHIRNAESQPPAPPPRKIY